MAAKGARGEAFLEVDGQTYPILFTNRAVAEAEQRTGKAFLHLLRSATTGDLGMSDVASLLLTGLEAARREVKTGKPYQLNQAFDLMDAVGFTQAASAVVEALAAILTFGAKEEGADETEAPPAQ